MSLSNEILDGTVRANIGEAYQNHSDTRELTRALFSAEALHALVHTSVTGDQAGKREGTLQSSEIVDASPLVQVIIPETIPGVTDEHINLHIEVNGSIIADLRQERVGDNEDYPPHWEKPKGMDPLEADRLEQAERARAQQLVGKYLDLVESTLKTLGIEAETFDRNTGKISFKRSDLENLTRAVHTQQHVTGQDSTILSKFTVSRDKTLTQVVDEMQQAQGKAVEFASQVLAGRAGTTPGVRSVAG